MASFSSEFFLVNDGWKTVFNWIGDAVRAVMLSPFLSRLALNRDFRMTTCTVTPWLVTHLTHGHPSRGSWDTLEFNVFLAVWLKTDKSSPFLIRINDITLLFQCFHVYGWHECKCYFGLITTLYKLFLLRCLFVFFSQQLLSKSPPSACHDLHLVWENKTRFYICMKCG